MRQAQQRHPSRIGGWTRASPELCPHCLLQQPVLIAVPPRSIFHQVLLWPPSVTQSVPGLGPRSLPHPEDAELPWRCEPRGRKRLCRFKSLTKAGEKSFQPFVFVFVTIWLLSPVSFAKGWFRAVLLPVQRNCSGSCGLGLLLMLNSCNCFCFPIWVNFLNLGPLQTPRIMRDVKAVIFLAVRKLCWFGVWVVFFLLFEAQTRTEL